MYVLIKALCIFVVFVRCRLFLNSLLPINRVNNKMRVSKDWNIYLSTKFLLHQLGLMNFETREFNFKETF